MKNNKHIERNEQSATKIFDNRSLQVDYRTLEPILKKGMTILDVGCGTGSISKDVANIVGDTGKVIGIDITGKFIESGRKTYKEVHNLELRNIDLFEFETEVKFDLIMCLNGILMVENRGLVDFS